MDLSIIIVNYKSSDVLENCLESIFKHQPSIKYEIIVIDNDSRDPGFSVLKENYKKVKFIENRKNRGFSVANNIAAESAEGEVLLFLNPDTIVKPDALDKMFKKIVQNPKIGIIGPKVLNFDGSVQKEGARRLPTLFSMFCNLFMLKMLFPNTTFFTEYIRNYDAEQEVQFVSGACLGIKNANFKKIGGFCEDYFMYSEDVDICDKARGIGLKNYYLPSALIVHLGGASSKKVPDSKIFEYWFFKSRREYFMKKGLISGFFVNLIYIFGGALRIIVGSIEAFLYRLFGKLKEFSYYKMVTKKYFRVFALGFNIDIHT